MKNKIEISIVTAYFNRKKLFYNSLMSLRKHYGIIDFEVIAVDDGSDENERLEDLKEEFPFLNLLRIEKESKWYSNSCVPFNIGLAASKGEKIIIQNPECYHFDNILPYVQKNLGKDDYLSFACFSLDKKHTEELTNLEDRESLLKLVEQNKIIPLNDGGIGWYNHSKYRPVAYHFCNALKKEHIESLGGFDERYAFGVGYDDDELVWRVKQSGLKIKFVDDVMVFHQNHYNDENQALNFDRNEKLQKNRRIFERRLKENKKSTIKYFLGKPYVSFYEFKANQLEKKIIFFLVKFLRLTGQVRLADILNSVEDRGDI